MGQPDNWLFDADCSTVAANMYNRFSDQMLNRRHPLFSIVTVPLTYGSSLLSGRPRLDTCVLVFSLAACLWAPVYYLALATLLSDRLAALLFALVGMFSASSMFWLSILERASYAGLSVVAGLLLLACAFASKERVSAFLGCASFVTLGFTITNCALAVFGGVARVGWKRTARVFFYAFAVMAFINVAASIYLPGGYFIGTVSADHSYAAMPGLSRVLEVGRNFWLHNMVAPHLQVIQAAYYPVPVMSIQRSALFSTGTPGTVATLAWILLLLSIPVTVRSLRKTGDGRLCMALVAYVAFQFVLSSLYGHETFLHSANYVPVVIALVALGAKTRIRNWVLACAAVLVVAAALNNAAQFHAMAAYTWTLR